MREEKAIITSNIQIKNDIYLMKVRTSGFLINPGEFALLSLDNYFLRRPISIYDVNGNEVSFLYKILGHGTKDMTSYLEGKEIDILFNAGNGFNMDISKKPLLIGGGIGIAPLFYLAKKFNEKGIRPIAILGFKNKNEVVLEDEFKKYCDLYITTDDGSYGVRGNPVTFLFNNAISYDHYYACGPLIMLKYLTKSFKNGEVSLEARMGCGFGACMGCSIETNIGVKRICKEGPVFLASEVSL